MRRFFLGLFFGVLLTVQAILFAGVGHGSYAPLAFAASITMFMPFLGLIAGPLLWGVYFMRIPQLQGRKRLVAFSGVLILHLLPGFWIAFDDPAFARADLGMLILFGLSLVSAIAFLLFLCFKNRRAA